MKLLSRNDAVRIVKDYLGKDFQTLEGRMHVFNVNETGIKGRGYLGKNARTECWVMYMKNDRAQTVQSPSRIICILKNTGEIVYDGSEGGETANIKGFYVHDNVLMPDLDVSQ